MGKRQEDNDDDADAGEGQPGGWFRLKLAVQMRIVGLFDRGIGLLQRQRIRFVPGGPTAEEEEAEKSRKAAATEALKTRRGRPLLTFLVATATLLVGLIAGAWFSFGLFAQRIESQSDFIANQADEVFEYNKDARHAERALENVKAENKDLQQQLEQAGAELQQAKARLAEQQGRAALYGDRPHPAGPAASGEEDIYASHPATSSGGKRMPNGTCQLESGSAIADLGKCLDRAR